MQGNTKVLSERDQQIKDFLKSDEITFSLQLILMRLISVVIH